MRVVQVGNVAGVAELIEAALTGHDVVRVPFRQYGARLPGLLKVAAAPLRVVGAFTTAHDVQRAHPDVVHVHWVPNAPVGMLADRPWILEAHGSDLRDLNVLRRRPYHAMIRRAGAFIVATPDLLDVARAVRPDAVYVPNAVLPHEPGDLRWDVGLASAAVPVKAPEVGFAVAFLLQSPSIWASDGPAFEPIVGVERAHRTTHAKFVERLAETRVVLGQFGIGAIGNVELEAMSVGRPVIAYVNPDWYPDPPPIISERDPHRIAGKVKALLRKPDEADRIGRAGREWVERHHSPKAVRDQLLEVYERVRRG